MFATVPILALFLAVTVLRLPDLSGASGRTTGFGRLTVDQLEAILMAPFPHEAYVLVRDQIARIQATPPVRLLSLGVAVALWTASSLSLTIIDALNRTYGVAETRSFLKLRLTAMTMTLLQGALMLGSFVSIVAWPQILRGLGLDPNGAEAWLAMILRWFVVLVVPLLNYAPTFYVGPAAQRRWVWITPGSLAGTAVLLVSSLLFRLYVQEFGSYDKTYGSLGGILLILFWPWVVGLVLLGAAEWASDSNRGKNNELGPRPQLHRVLPSRNPSPRGLIRKVSFENGDRESRSQGISRSRRMGLAVFGNHRSREGWPGKIVVFSSIAIRSPH